MPDGGVDGPAGAGLRVALSTQQDIPGTIGSDIMLDRARFHADTIRSFGDAAPGDSRTTQSDVRLYFEDGEGPMPIQFVAAPAGLYSSVQIRLQEGNDAEEHAYGFKGQVNVAGTWHPFEIEAHNLLTIELPTSTTLPPGGSAAIGVDVNIAAILSSIDWSAYPPDGEGEISIEGNVPAIDAAVMAAFTLTTAQ